MGKGNWDVHYKDSKAPNPPKDEIVLPRKKQTGKKNFIIECRWLKWNMDKTRKWDNWHSWKRYDTQKKRDEAFKTLQKTHRDWEFIEFRLQA